MNSDYSANLRPHFFKKLSLVSFPQFLIHPTEQLLHQLLLKNLFYFSTKGSNCDSRIVA